MRKSEVTGVAKILLSDGEFETAEDAAKAIINWLDNDRAKRKSYVAVMQFGTGPAWYIGLGPYPGEASAKKAVASHPGASMAHKIAVVPVTSKEGLEALLRDVDAKVTKA